MASFTEHEPHIQDEVIRKSFTKPYGAKKPVPTVQGYRQHRKELENEYGSAADLDAEEEKEDSKHRRAFESAKSILKGEDDHQTHHDPYPVSNHNDAQRLRPQQVEKRDQSGERDRRESKDDSKKHRQSATEEAAGAIDMKDKRKAMKKHNNKRGGGREVTDPVTHLPLYIRDQTERDMKSVPENEQIPGTHHRNTTGLSGANKTQSELDAEQQEIQRSYNGLQKTFPPPAFEDVKNDLSGLYALALTVGLAAVSILALVTLITVSLTLTGNHSRTFQGTVFVITLCLATGTAAVLIYGIRGWLASKVSEIWDDQTWEALRQDEKSNLDSEAELPESVQWLNSVLSSVWPLINPDLFTSLVDMLEDVMQASLPKVVRMVSIDDAGQGTESFRILGIKWLPTGAASQSVDDKGRLTAPDKNKNSDRVAPGEGEEDPNAGDGDSGDEADTRGLTDAQKKQQEQEQQAVKSGMEAEEGEFVNMELAFAYRARPSGRSLNSKAKNAHLYLKFYLPGGIAVPIWVELRGLMGIMRVRMQLTPDPPFLSLCTMTFLGQPQVDLSCIPLSKHSLNVMDIPLISGFVQSSINAAMAEFVAPKSLTLDLKDMIVGEDYKKDTSNRGVVWILIKRASGFKQGDGGIGPLEGSSDAYVSVSWGKFGKPVASTRIIENEQEPVWHEWSSILVSPDELNAQERLRLQLWDSDKWTADDDLGRVEVDLKELMSSEDTKNKMSDREDRFKGEDLEEDMPGTLTWSVGYFEKSKITDEQLSKQTFNTKIRSRQDLEKMVSEMSEQKLREAKGHGYEKEIHQQKVQDYKEQEENMIISAPPSRDKPSGILGIQIHNITGLEVEKLQKASQEGERPDSEEHTDDDPDLPDSYCTIILNHQKIYRTRTKPKNSKPFYNAGTERFVKDWTTAEVIVSVRDSREKEDDALLGVIYLPLAQLFKKRSQLIDFFPVAGGVGHGKARISLIWRSVEVQLSPHLRGWDLGTLEIKGSVKVKGQLDQSLTQHRMKLRTNLSKIKLEASDGAWEKKRNKSDDSVFLAVRLRYASTLMVEFRKTSLGLDDTPAFAVLWLSELTDEEEETKVLTVWKGGKKNLKRARSCHDYKGLEEGQQPLGQIEITMKFWSGLSGYHKSWSSKSSNKDARDVIECLDTINDENMEDAFSDESDSDTETEDEIGRGGPSKSRDKGQSQTQSDDPDLATRKKLKTHTGQSSRDSENGDSDVESTESSGFSKIKAPLNKVQDLASTAIDKIAGDQDNQDDGSRGARAQLKDYKDHHRQLHRKHRGIMQFRGARTANWAGGKVRRAKDKLVSSLTQHSEKDQGMETEV